LQIQHQRLAEVEIKINTVPVTVASGEEISVLVAIECLRPFKESLSMNLQFSLGGASYNYSLKLPFILSSFFEPVASDKTTYMNRWKVLENEVQEIFQSSNVLNSEYFKYIRNFLFPRLKIGFASELDSSEKTFTGSFSFQTGSVNSEGNHISVGGMLRLEGDSTQNRFRVTIRSKHMVVSEAVRDLLKYFLV
jgi:hypothetical protein